MTGTRRNTARKSDPVSRHPGEPWRVGVILDSDAQPQWIAHALTLIRQSTVATIAATVFTPPSHRAVGEQPADRYRLFRWFVRADRRVFRRRPDPLEMTLIGPLLDDAECIRVPDSMSVDQDLGARLQEAELDVILCLGSIEVGRQLIPLARHGVWYFPDLASIGGIARPVGWDATIAGVATVETSICDLAPDGTRGQTRYRTVSAVNRCSPHYTERRLLWKMATYPLRALPTLAAGSSAIDDRSDSVATPTLRATPSVAPGGPTLLGSIARLGGRLAAHAARTALFRTEWTLAYCRDDSLPIETLTCRNPPGTYTLIENRPDRSWADPFPVTDGDKRWLFVEEFPHGAHRAHLSVMELRTDGSLGPATPVLERPYHLSYPFVFQWRSEWYMVPESLDNKSVDLYRSLRFPHQWTPVHRLLDGVSAADPTLAEIDGRWWMFATIAPTGGSENDELHIFHADSPLGPWLPHARNPQMSDVRRARPAGRIFRLHGAWYRPAQDCSRRYGYAMTINRITALSETEFAETCVARIEPTWARGLLGTHTFNHLSGITFVDGNRRRPRPSFRRGR